MKVCVEENQPNYMVWYLQNNNEKRNVINNPTFYIAARKTFTRRYILQENISKLVSDIYRGNLKQSLSWSGGLQGVVELDTIPYKKKN